MSANEGLPTFRVVGVRFGGERMLISTHASQLTAEKVIRLIGNCAGYDELRIEDEARSRGRRRSRRKK